MKGESRPLGVGVDHTLAIGEKYGWMLIARQRVEHRNNIFSRSSIAH